jgi:hypothetical protein
MRVCALVITSILIAACTRPAEPPPAPATSTTSEMQDDDTPEGVLVTEPGEGTPEAVLQTVIAAAMNPDEAAGWESLRSMLHSSISAAHALQNYREMNFQASRRKVNLFTPNDTLPYFRVVKTTLPGTDKIKFFVHNEKSMPTPCTLRRDSEADGAWRVYVCSL